MSEATQQAEVMPYLREDGSVCVPFDAPTKYRFWQAGGQPIYITMIEFGATVEAFKRYGGRIEHSGEACKCEKKAATIGDIYLCAPCNLWWGKANGE